MVKILIILAVLLVFPVNTFSGPFGTNMGDSDEQYDALMLSAYNEATDVITYERVKLPNGIDEFSRYFLDFGPTGLQRVSGVAKMTEKQCKDSRLFFNLYDNLEAKYKKPTRHTREYREVSGYDSNDYRWYFNKDNSPDNIYSIELSDYIKDGQCTITLDYAYQNSLQENKSSNRNKKDNHLKYKDKL